jgi:hypothetical protein
MVIKMSSKFFNKYFKSVDLNSQPCYHLVYPSNSFKILKMIKEPNKLKQLTYTRKLITKNTMDNVNFLGLIATGNFVHNYIQSNPSVREDYICEYYFQFPYKCLLIAGKIDLISKDFLEIIEIKSSSKSYLRDYWLLQLLIYCYVISKTQKISIEKMKLTIVVVTKWQVIEYDIQPSYAFVEECLDKYIELIHKIESCEIGKKRIILHYEGKDKNVR